MRRSPPDLPKAVRYKRRLDPETAKTYDHVVKRLFLSRQLLLNDDIIDAYFRFSAMPERPIASLNDTEIQVEIEKNNLLNSIYYLTIIDQFEPDGLVHANFMDSLSRPSDIERKKKEVLLPDVFRNYVRAHSKSIGANWRKVGIVVKMPDEDFCACIDMAFESRVRFFDKRFAVFYARLRKTDRLLTLTDIIDSDINQWMLYDDNSNKKYKAESSLKDIDAFEAILVENNIQNEKITERLKNSRVRAEAALPVKK